MNRSGIRCAAVLAFSVVLAVDASLVRAQCGCCAPELPKVQCGWDSESRAESGEPSTGSPSRDGVLSRILRLPGRLIGIDSGELRLNVRRRIRNRIADYRARRWTDSGGFCWYTSYEQAYLTAQSDHKMLLIFFAEERWNVVQEQFETVTLADRSVTTSLSELVCVRVPVTEPHIHYAAQERGNRALISDPAFAHLEGRPGIVIVDLAGDDKPELAGHVTFVRPFTSRPCSAVELTTILSLPRSSLTQRTMIYAVRMHPERPQSTEGQLTPYLLDQAARHSQHMADLQVQGHHGWDTRFHQISAMLGSSFSAREVVAESWGHERLIDAAIECVHSWRQSPGHWAGVQARHHFYGYDMKLGANGKWYATGLFGDSQ